MTKKLGILLLLALCLSVLFLSSAMADIVASGSCGDNVTWTLDNGGLLTISGTGVMDNFDLETPWDSNCGFITAVQIENGVTSIGDFAFYYCTSLTSVTISDSVTSIGDFAFYYCTSLTSVTIPDSVTSIGDFAFNNCNNLTSVTIPSGVTSIPFRAFNSCDSLTSVTIQFGVTSIGNEAFSLCKSLTSVTIPTSVTSIEDFAFNYCFSLTDVYYSGSREEWAAIYIVEWGNEPLINTQIHYNYGGITNILTLPASLTTIESGAFTGLDNMDAVSIPATVASIAEDAFDAGIVIIAPAGSYAETWATEHGFTVNHP